MWFHLCWELIKKRIYTSESFAVGRTSNLPRAVPLLSVGDPLLSSSPWPRQFVNCLLKFFPHLLRIRMYDDIICRSPTSTDESLIYSSTTAIFNFFPLRFFVFAAYFQNAAWGDYFSILPRGRITFLTRHQNIDSAMPSAWWGVIEWQAC